MFKPRLFVAGATGATGKVLVPMAEKWGIPVVAHVRPKSQYKAQFQRTSVFELSHAEALDHALTGCSTVISLIGTMRSRFSKGDTYETSDIDTTRYLVEAAKRTGVSHFILLSSVGAGFPLGSYLRAKAKAEALVRDSGLPYTLFRPSALEGGERKPIPYAKPLLHALHLKRFEPISLHELSSAMLHCAVTRQPMQCAVEGGTLWKCVEAASAH